MVRMVKIAMNSFITGVFGLSLTLFSVYFLDRKPATFWTLAVLIWLIAGVINGYLLNDWKESLIAGSIISGLIFFIAFLFILILRIFSDAVVEYFSGFDFITPGNLFSMSFLIGFLFALGAFLIFSAAAIATVYIRESASKTKGVQSAADYETELYQKYEQPADVGKYRSSKEREDV